MSEGQAEIKAGLRKMEFPQCAKEALLKICNLVCTGSPSIKQMDFALDLMAEFVFCEVDRRGNKRPIFNPIQEFQLLEVLYDCLMETYHEAPRNTVFINLFSGTTASQRLGILSKLVSLAMGTNASEILTSASTWMQQLGNTSVNSCKLAENLIADYFILLPDSLDGMEELPLNSPQFTANFLTAIGELYFVDSNLHFPPQCLLEAVTTWVNSDDTLCLAAQLRHHHLPPGAIAMEATTPIAGLLKWTILAPIYGIESEWYSRLHLGLLNSLLEIPISPTPRAISATALSQPNGAILKYTLDLEKKAKAEKVDKEVLIRNDEVLQLALDRYAQAAQIALSVNCVYGNIDEFITQLQYLPYNTILKIVINKYKGSK